MGGFVPRTKNQIMPAMKECSHTFKKHSMEERNLCRNESNCVHIEVRVAVRCTSQQGAYKVR